jgi:predicted dehydrogenase
MRRVSVGLAGLGRMGRIHARNLASRCAVARLGAVHDADPDVAKAVADELDVPWVESYAELLDGTEAVAIATPTGLHAEMVEAAATAGRAVFCEKPLSLDRDTSLRAIEATERAGVALQVGFHRRFDPDWVAVAARIQAGELGRITLLRTSLRDMIPPDPAFLASSGGFFADMTVHDLDMARWLAGEVVEVSAHGAALDPAFAAAGELDTAAVVLRFASGALGLIDNARAAGYGYECSTEVMGTLATARIDTPRGPQWLTPGQAARPLPRDFAERFPLAYVEELDAFARCVRDGGEPLATGRDAVAASDLAAAAERSRQTGRTITVGEFRGA